MDTKQMRWAASAFSAEAVQVTNLRADLPAEDGVMRIGATRIGHAYIFARENPNPASDSDLLFEYDAAGNQIRREVKKGKLSSVVKIPGGEGQFSAPGFPCLRRTEKTYACRPSLHDALAEVYQNIYKRQTAGKACSADAKATRWPLTNK